MYRHMGVLRLPRRRHHGSLLLLYLHNYTVLRVATAVRTLAPAIGLGIIVGFGGTGGVYAMLILSAVVVAIAQQTLP